jgi:hypothetical protein
MSFVCQFESHEARGKRCYINDRSTPKLVQSCKSRTRRKRRHVGGLHCAQVQLAHGSLFSNARIYMYIFWMGGQARAAFTLKEWMSFWEEYTVRTLEGCMSIDVRAPVVVVSHEQLGRDPVGTVRRLVDDLIEVGVDE